FDKEEAKTPVANTTGKVLMPLIIPTAENQAETVKLKQEVEALVPDQPAGFTMHQPAIQTEPVIEKTEIISQQFTGVGAQPEMVGYTAQTSQPQPQAQQTYVQQPHIQQPHVQQPQAATTPAVPSAGSAYIRQPQPPATVYHKLEMPEEQPVEPVAPVNQHAQTKPLVLFTLDDERKNNVEKNRPEAKPEWIHSQSSAQAGNISGAAASGGYLSKPSNIYAESKAETSTPENQPTREIPKEPVRQPIREEDPSAEEMQLVIKSNVPAAEEPGAYQTPNHVMNTTPAEEPAMQDEVGEQKRRAAERIQKLRNLSFNINAVDPNNEFETVPAYIRRNLELYNTINNVENFYSNYEVKSDENNKTQISTINTFLDGKKPD
ncbi:MAG: hypothetical protein ABW174_11435, partial [Flavitalea sp.]